MFGMMLKVFGALVIFCGVILILGAAGSDCDGKCMENSLTITEILLYCLSGFCMIGLGYMTYIFGDRA
jgi:hypothetical protein